MIRLPPGFAAGSAGLATIAASAPIDLLEAIEPHLPGHRHVDLAPAISVIVVWLTAHRLDQASEPEARARLQARLAWRLGNAGQHQQALAADGEATRPLSSLARSLWGFAWVRAAGHIGGWRNDCPQPSPTTCGADLRWMHQRIKLN